MDVQETIQAQESRRKAAAAAAARMEEARLAAARAAALTKQARLPVFWSGGSDVAARFRRRMLRPVDGCAAWATVDRGANIFLYYRPNKNRWVIDSEYNLESTSQFAYIVASSDGLLPEGEAVWTSYTSFRDVTEGEEWMETVLTLSVGAAAEAEIARLEVCRSAFIFLYFVFRVVGGII